MAANDCSAIIIAAFAGGVILGVGITAISFLLYLSSVTEPAPSEQSEAGKSENPAKESKESKDDVAESSGDEEEGDAEGDAEGDEEGDDAEADKDKVASSPKEKSDGDDKEAKGDDDKVSAVSSSPEEKEDKERNDGNDKETAKDDDASTPPNAPALDVELFLHEVECAVDQSQLDDGRLSWKLDETSGEIIASLIPPPNPWGLRT